MLKMLFSLRVPAISVATALLVICSSSNAGEPAISAVSAPASSGADTRYGLFNLLDHRSAYGHEAFPEPFLVDDSALEDDEFRLDWLHTKAGAHHGDKMKAELEKGFGVVTLELEIPVEHDYSNGHTVTAFNNVNLGARCPVFQAVSADGFFDTTFGAAIEGGIPTNSSLSKNGEIVPKIFNNFKVGSHFTLQSVFGYSALFGGGPDRGLHTFEYGFVFGYTIPHKELPLPDVLQLIPIFELKGETTLNKENAGRNILLGDVGVRANLKAIGAIQPRLGVAFVFPIGKAARADAHWGVATSLVFEY